MSKDDDPQLSNIAKTLKARIKKIHDDEVAKEDAQNASDAAAKAMRQLEKDGIPLNGAKPKPTPKKNGSHPPGGGDKPASLAPEKKTESGPTTKEVPPAAAKDVPTKKPSAAESTAKPTKAKPPPKSPARPTADAVDALAEALK